MFALARRKCRDPGSNRGPSDLRSDALPTELSRLRSEWATFSLQLQVAIVLILLGRALVFFQQHVIPPRCAMEHGAHGVVVSHPLRMRKALGSNPSVSIFPNCSAFPAPCFVLSCACRSASAALQRLGKKATVTPKATFGCRHTRAIGICKGKQMGTWCSGITPA